MSAIKVMFDTKSAIATARGSATVTHTFIDDALHDVDVRLDDLQRKDLLLLSMSRVRDCNSIVGCDKNLHTTYSVLDDQQLTVMWREIGKHLHAKGLLSKAEIIA